MDSEVGTALVHLLLGVPVNISARFALLFTSTPRRYAWPLKRAASGHKAAATGNTPGPWNSLDRSVAEERALCWNARTKGAETGEVSAVPEDSHDPSQTEGRKES